MKRLLVLVALLVPLSVFVAGCGCGTGGSSGPKGGLPYKEEMAQKEAELKQKMAEAKKVMGKSGSPSR